MKKNRGKTLHKCTNIENKEKSWYNSNVVYERINRIYKKWRKKQTMKCYNIYYDLLKNPEQYLESLSTLLEGNQHICFHVDGISVELNPEDGWETSDIDKRIQQESRKVARNGFIRTLKRSDEPLTEFLSTLIKNSKKNNVNYSYEYNGGLITISPGTSLEEACFKVWQINNAWINARESKPKIINISPNMNPVQIGIEVSNQANHNRKISHGCWTPSIIAKYGEIKVPFTPDLLEIEEGNKKPSSIGYFAKLAGEVPKYLDEMEEALSQANINNGRKQAVGAIRPNIVEVKTKRGISPWKMVLNALMHGISFQNVNDY